MIRFPKALFVHKPVVFLALISLILPAPHLQAQEKALAAESSAQVPGSASLQKVPSVENLESVPVPSAANLIRDIKKSAWLKTIDMERGELALVSGRSQLLRLERPIARVSVSNPVIVDAVIISPNEILLNAKGEGAVNVIFWDHQNRVSVYDITVTRDPNLLHAVLHKISPESNFEVYPSNDVYVVKGDVDSVAKQKEVEQAANAFAEGSVSLVRVTDAKQVLLRTRFIQLDHAQDYDFGLDVQYLGKHFGPLIRPGGTGATLDEDSPFTPRDSVVSYNTLSTVPSASGVHWFPYFTRDRAVNTFIKAIETRGIGKIIARPNLLASDGQEASFLVGGEAAVVAISNDNVGVQYKEFGTRLTFTPEILPSGKIRLTVAPEVSALDFANGVSVNNVTIPSFTTVRTKTVVELQDSETFMIGGLLQQKITVDERGVPFLRRMPVIGKLFDNTNNSYSDSELLVVVTPIIVNPLKTPLSDDNEADGLIEQASKMHPYRVNDENMQAIDKYLRQSREELQGEIKKYQSNTPLNAAAASQNTVPEPVVVKVEIPAEKKAEVPAPEKPKAAEVKKELLPASTLPGNSVKKEAPSSPSSPPPAVRENKSPVTVKSTPAALPVQVPIVKKEETKTPATVSVAAGPSPSKSLDELEAELEWQNRVTSTGKAAAPVPAAKKDAGISAP